MEGPSEQAKQDQAVSEYLSRYSGASSKCVLRAVRRASADEALERSIQAYLTEHPGASYKEAALAVAKQRPELF